MDKDYEALLRENVRQQEALAAQVVQLVEAGGETRSQIGFLRLTGFLKGSSRAAKPTVDLDQLRAEHRRLRTEWAAMDGIAYHARVKQAMDWYEAQRARLDKMTRTQEDEFVSEAAGRYAALHAEWNALHSRHGDGQHFVHYPYDVTGLQNALRQAREKRAELPGKAAGDDTRQLIKAWEVKMPALPSAESFRGLPGIVTDADPVELIREQALGPQGRRR